MRSRPITRRVAACVTLLLTACSRHASNPDVDAAVAAFDRQFAEIEVWRAAFGKVVSNDRAIPQNDFRGHTIAYDADRWILTDKSRREIKDLRDRAASSAYLPDAQQLLKQASERAKADAPRVSDILRYWTKHLPAPYWRGYWHDLYSSNGVPEEAPDSMLVSIEARITQALERGDFDGAGKDADELNAVFAESMNRATNRIFKTREAPADLTPRKTACPTGRTAPRGEKPTLVRGESIESFYPPDAIKRGESGSVVLRALVDTTGCAKSVAIQVRSGMPALDAAALDWFETASFTPGSAQGKPVDSVIVWKVRFELREN